MMALKTAGEVILLGLKTMTVNFEMKVLKRPRPERKLIKCFIIIISCMIILICILAAAETALEGWSFLDGVYCWFVTFTTMGFGDFVPFAQYREENINTPWKVYITGLIFTVPFIAGLCLVSSLLNVIVQSSENIKIHFHQVCSSCGHRAELKTEANDDDSKVANGIRLQSYGIRAQGDAIQSGVK